MPENALTHILIMAVCIILSAYFSATETAFSSFNKTRLKTIAEKGNKRAILACKLSDKYDNLISTILIGNNIVNILIASIGTVLFVNMYGDIGTTISTAVVTVLVLIFGEVVPKSIAKDCPEKFVMFSSPFINMLIWIFTPFNFLLLRLKELISKCFKFETNDKMSQEELLMLVEEVEENGSIDENESELLQNAIEFKDRDAEDILTHRIDLEAVSVDSTKEEIAQVFSESKFSRLLVYDGSIDNIIGLIHLKDFYTGTGVTEKSLKELVSPVVFVPRGEKINELLRELQKSKSHVAVVIDEHGGTYGIVTMEDILEELVGEIWDEHDEATEFIKQIGANTYIVDAALSLNDFSEYFEKEIDSDMVLLNGWVMEMLEGFPVVGDTFKYENLDITVNEMENQRISQIRVFVNKTEEIDKADK